MFKHMIPRLSAKLGDVVRKVVRGREVRKERKRREELTARLAQWTRKSPLIGGEDERREEGEQLAPVATVSGEEERSEREEQVAAPDAVVEDAVLAEDEDDVFFDAEETGVPEGPGERPGTPLWVKLVEECAVEDGEEHREVRVMRGKRGVVRSASDALHELEWMLGFGEGMQEKAVEKGVGWWEEFMTGERVKRSTEADWLLQVRLDWVEWRQERGVEHLKEIDVMEERD
ncbi:hypothetical protein FKW77_006469 [Venturia effusa]|uniref:Uncharacterized protein n=1 Tax=Venturia effusa TaxID=50376 RepID=A0A517LAY8_9PEZI|nr:hypothetical protein FKW77_006469 [Venturia effusa]